MGVRFQYQVRAEPLDTSTGVPTLDKWGPDYPVYVFRRGVAIQQIWPTPADQIADVPLVSGWLPTYPERIPRLTLLTAQQRATVLNPEPIPTAPLDLGWAALHPDWLPPPRLPDLSFFVQPIAPTPVIAPPRLGLDAFTATILEQTSGTYTTILVDEIGRPISALLLSTLTLTLYAIRSDGTIAFINGRQVQNVYNANGVTLYGGVQTRSDGRQYNLVWKVQPADTTMVDDDLAFERHIALFEYSWDGGTRQGKHEMVVNVQRVGEV
jgi:hypothetical protein